MYIRTYMDIHGHNHLQEQINNKLKAIIASYIVNLVNIHVLLLHSLSVLWSGETKVECFGHHSEKKKKEKKDSFPNEERHTVSAVKHRGGSITL